MEVGVMGFFRRLFNQKKRDGSMPNLPSDWEQTLHECNYFMARRAVSEMFRIANQNAEANGVQAVFKKEIVDCWDHFFENPSYETAAQFLSAMPEVYRIFLGCCPGGQWHRPALRTATEFSVGNCCLQSNTEEVTLLRQLTGDEYAFFQRQFKGEVIYHAKPIDLLGREWTFTVSVVKGKLYKWAASLELGADEDVARWGHDVFQYCECFLGSPTDEKEGVFFWDTPDGNVILQLIRANDLVDVSIFATSREVRNLERLMQ